MSTTAAAVSSVAVPNTTTNTWTHELSFASPESDFCCARQMSTEAVPSIAVASSNTWTHQLSLTTPESDFVGQLVQDSSNEQGAGVSTVLSTFLGGTSSQSHSNTNVNVPKTFKEALQLYNEAIVVTAATAPHTILYVNKAWENMCGYTLSEAIDPTLQCIQGPKTNAKLAQS
jgi:PAS domain-containing protein